MWILRWLLLIIVLFFLVGFLSQNKEPSVQVQVFGWVSPDMPLSYALFLAGIAGYFLAMIVALINQLRLRSQIAAMRRRNREMQIELDRLRNLALESEMPPTGIIPPLEEDRP